MEQPPTIGERIRYNDQPLVRPFGHPVSINEWHALVLGGSVGTLAAIASVPGLVFVALAISALYPARSDWNMFVETLAHEPWYAISALVFGFAIADRLARHFF